MDIYTVCIANGCMYASLFMCCFIINQAGDTQTVQTLLVFGANINALDANDKTPLDLVVGPYRFLTHQECGFTVIDIDKTATSPSTPNIPNKRPTLKAQPSYDGEVAAVPQHPRVHSAVTAFTSSFAKSGNVGAMAELLREYGGKRGNEIAPMTKRDVRQPKLCRVQQFQDMIMTESKETMATPAKVHKSDGLEDDWTTKIATLYYQISSYIERKLLDIAHPLSQYPDEAMAVGIQMKELKMLRDAGSRVLFLDGGGMKGLAQIEILSQLEEQTGRRITELFDWIVGTSTGGITALALVHGKPVYSIMQSTCAWSVYYLCIS